MSTEVFFPPGPAQSLFLGNAPQFQHSPLQYMLDAARAHGEIVHFRLGPAHAYLVVNPALAHDVLAERPNIFAERWGLLRALNSAFGHDLFPPKEAAHRPRYTPPLFRKAWLDEMAIDMAEATGNALAGWTPSEDLELLPFLRNLTRQIAATCITNGMSAGRLATLEASGASRRAHARLPLADPHVAESGWAAWRITWRAFSELLVDTRGCCAGSLVARLRAAAEERGLTPQSLTQLREEALDVFVAGYEAAAHVVAAALYLLVTNPEAEATLVHELNHARANDETADDQVYTEMVLREAMRLYPPAAVVVRQATRETRLGRYYLPSGSTVYVSPYVMHRSSRYYADPESFIPERFSSAYERRLAPYSYMPFGAGSRTQIADAVTIVIAKTVLEALTRDYQFAPLQNEPHTSPQPFADLRLSVTRRVAAQAH